MLGGYHHSLPSMSPWPLRLSERHATRVAIHFKNTSNRRPEEVSGEQSQANGPPTQRAGLYHSSGLYPKGRQKPRKEKKSLYSFLYFGIEMALRLL